MRTLTLYTLAAGLLAVGTSFGAGQIEMRKHRFSRHESQGFERLVLEFKNSGQDLPSVRVGTDGTAGEVTIQVGDVAVRGNIPESEINDHFVPLSKLLGPISISTDNARGGFTVRTFLKVPQSRIDAFWLDNPTRLVVDAYGNGGGSRNSASMRSSRKHGGSPHAKTGGYKGEVVCFPTTASVGMQVTFQATGKKIDSIALPVEGGRGGEDGSVVCYPKSTQLSASISFDLSAVNGVKSVKSVKNRRITPNRMDEEIADPVQATPTPVQEMPVVKAMPTPMTLPSSPVMGGAPANNLFNKSPLTLEPPKALSLSIPSPATAQPPPGLLSLPSPGAAPKPGAPIMGLSLPAPSPARTLSADAIKSGLNLPLTLPSLPQPGTTPPPAAGGGISAPPLKLSLPPPQSAQQLLPPPSTK